MKKLCAIATISGTLQAFVIEAMRVLKKDGYDITLIASMNDSFIEQYGEEFNCINIEMKRGINLIESIKVIAKLYKVFKKEKFDYIQYATPNASFYASIASRLVKCPIRVYCQWGIRYVGFSGLKRKLFKLLEIITCRLSTHIRPASKKNLLFAVSERHYPLEKAAVIGDGGTIGVDFKVFDKNKKNQYRQEVLQEYPDLNYKFIFGFIGRIDKDKGIEELFKAFLNVNKQNANTCLLIIGSEDKINEVDVELYELVKKCNAIIFTGYKKNVAKYISVIDTLIHPSYREGFSMVIQQAMAMEIAIITTDIPGPSEVIENGISGLLVPAKDYKALYSTMLYVQKNDDLRKSLSYEAYIRASKLFTRERMLDLTYKDRVQLISML